MRADGAERPPGDGVTGLGGDPPGGRPAVPSDRVTDLASDAPGGRPALPGGPVGPRRRTARYLLAGVLLKVAMRCYVRLRVEGADRLPRGPAVLCFSHQSWTDPFVLVAVLPLRPRLYFFGPKEDDMAIGGRNQLMSWVGTTVPYRPAKNDLLDATRRVAIVFAAGGTLAIAGEGRIHAGEGTILPLSDGPAFFALRNGVPLVPIAINGTGWLAFARTVRVRIGEPLAADGRPTRERVAALTAGATRALEEAVADFPDRRPPGRFGRWLTELFNDWPEGARPPDPPA